MKKKKTYNSRCSPVVTHLTTNLPLIGLTLGEQTGSRIFQWIWSYVTRRRLVCDYNHGLTTYNTHWLAKLFLNIFQLFPIMLNWQDRTDC